MMAQMEPPDAIAKSHDWWLPLPCGHYLPVSLGTPVAALTPYVLSHQDSCAKEQRSRDPGFELGSDFAGSLPAKARGVAFR